MNRKLLLISGIIVVIVIMVVVFAIPDFSPSPKVILKVENFQFTLEQTKISGVYVPYVTKANFTITNIGDKDSTSCLIFIDSSAVSYAVPRDPIKIDPIKSGETKLVVLGALGRGYPDLSLQYGGKSYQFHFGEETTIESFG